MTGTVQGVAGVAPPSATGVTPGSWEGLDLLARNLHSQPTVESTLATILEWAVSTMPDVDAAGVNLFLRKKFTPQAVLGAAPPVLDDLQQASGNGPCIDASRTQSTMVVDDFSTDRRWPEFAMRATELGVASIACVPLWVDSSRLGSLSLYSSRRRAFSSDGLKVANLLATHAALAIATARRADNLAIAVDSRDVIGQAKGILMERLRITADVAFALISASSQATQLKVQAVAEVIATTGELPEATRPPAVAEPSAV